MSCSVRRCHVEQRRDTSVSRAVSSVTRARTSSSVRLTPGCERSRLVVVREGLVRANLRASRALGAGKRRARARRVLVVYPTRFDTRTYERGNRVPGPTQHSTSSSSLIFVRSDYIARVAAEPPHLSSLGGEATPRVGRTLLVSTVESVDVRMSRAPRVRIFRLSSPCTRVRLVVTQARARSHARSAVRRPIVRSRPSSTRG